MLKSSDMTVSYFTSKHFEVMKGEYI